MYKRFGFLSDFWLVSLSGIYLPITINTLLGFLADFLLSFLFDNFTVSSAWGNIFNGSLSKFDSSNVVS